jgi:PPP family 3-phenylpropionic acid transporter
MKKIWPFSFYFLYYAGMASFMPFVVLFYQELGFGGVQIGLLTGVPPLVTLFAGPFLAGVADSTRRHNLILGAGILGAAVIIFSISMLSDFVVIFLLVLLFNVFFSPVASLGDSATMTMLGEERAMYGRVRLGGTIGWGIFAQIAGILLYRFGLAALFYVFSAVMLVNFFVSMKLSFGKREEHDVKRESALTLLTNRRWIIFLLSAFFGGLGSMSVAAYLSPYLQELGANGNQIGFAFTIATLTELPVFFFGDILVKRFKPYGLFLISLVLIGFRSIFFGLVNTVFMAIVVQAIGGMFFPAMWSAGVAYAYENAPAGLKSTAQSIFGAASFGIGSAVGGLICGILLESLGGRGMFMVLGIIILAGLALIEGAKRLIPERELAKA